MKLSIIVAHGNHYELGLNNQLLWRIPEDLKKFKELTSGHHILMGRKTFESIGRPLPNRVSLIVSKSGHYTDQMENVHSFKSIEDAIAFAESKHEPELFIIGGAQIYNQMMDKVDTMYLSEVDFDGEADAFLNPIKYDDFQLVEEDYHISTETTPAWRFKKLVRR